MAINLASKYSDIIQTKFVKSSFLAGNVSEEYSFAGVKSITIMTPETIEPVDYNRSATSNRFGTPTEMQDNIQELTMGQDKSFSLVIDRGNNEEQLNLKKAGKMLSLQISEKVTPMIDKYAFARYCALSGTVKGVTAPTKSTAVGMIFDCATAMDNALVPADNRFLYMSASFYNLVRNSDEFFKVETLAEKALTKGMVGEIADMKAIKVPDSYLPTGVHFIAIYKPAVLLPHKIRTARILTDVQGIDGSVLEGRNNFEAFVLKEKCEGVYTCATSTYVVANPAISITTNDATITCATGSAVIKYTLDGSDPRYNEKALTYSAPVTLTSGQTIKAYATKTAMLPSAVTSATNS